MTPLEEVLHRQIAATGPMTVADYMALCLGHPRHGYYATRDPLGAAGDFTTAPEISQMFGEMLGLCLAQCWMDQGAPARFALAELGPGRGTLMRDILRATRGVPGFADAAEVHLVETSAVLREIQAEAVSGAQFHDTTASLPDLPLFLVANEFLDALPVRQFLREGEGWRERVVGLREKALTFGLAAAEAREELSHRLGETQEGDMVETSAGLAVTLAPVAERIAAQGGAALFVDYGDWRATGDTLQAVRRHEKVDPLSTPGKADLTAHVDFEAVAAAAAPAQATQMTGQGLFLERLGITERARTLAAKLSGEALESHIAAHRRLTHPGEMGHLFKVIGYHPAGSAPPPGLEP